MSKRILVSVACLGIIWVVGANAERLLAEEDPFGNASGEQVAETPITEEEDDPFGRGARRGGEMGRGGSGMPMGMGGSMGMAGEMGIGKIDRNALAMAAAMERAQIEREQSAFAGRSGLGTFTVVSSDKRSILLNTATGEGWQLMIDNPGSHWEPIAMGVSKGGKTEISWPTSSSGESLEQLRKHEQLRVQQEQDSDRQVNRSTNDQSKLEDQLRHLSDELSKSKRRELKLEAALRSFEKSQIQNEEVEAEEKKDIDDNAASSKKNNPIKSLSEY